MNREHWVQALEDFSRACELQPNEKLCWLHQSDAFSRLERHKEAAEAAQKALILCPKDKDIRRTLVLEQLASGNYEDALENINQLIRDSIDPEDIEIRDIIRENMQ